MSEPAVDTGGVSREFWRLFVKGVQSKLCIGEDASCVFDLDVQALQV